MYDAVGEFRSRAMERIRDLVASHYCFGDPKDHGEKVAKLLNKDDFTVDDGSGVSLCPRILTMLTMMQTGHTRFAASVIVKAIAKVFFHPNSRLSFGRKEHTAKLFRCLHGETVVFISVCIAFALKEFSSGKRVPAKFEGAEVEGMLLEHISYYIS
jgi:Domain of unknown function (DUF6532)